MTKRMSFREFLQTLKSAGQALTISQEVDPHLQMAALIHQLDEQPVLFAVSYTHLMLPTNREV